MAASAAGARKKLEHDRLHWPGGFEVPIVIRKSLNRIRVADVNELRIITYRIKRNAKRLMQPGRESCGLLRLSVLRDPAIYNDLTLVAFGQEHISVRCGPQLAWLIQPAGVLIHLESGRRLWRRICGPRTHLRRIHGRPARSRRRQVVDCDLVGSSRRFRAKVIEDERAILGASGGDQQYENENTQHCRA